MYIQVNKRIPPAGLELAGRAFFFLDEKRLKRARDGRGLGGASSKTQAFWLSGFSPVCSQVCCWPPAITQADSLLQTLISGERPGFWALCWVLRYRRERSQDLPLSFLQAGDQEGNSRTAVSQELALCPWSLAQSF